jgi:hypothetical protein
VLKQRQLAITKKIVKENEKALLKMRKLKSTQPEPVFLGVLSILHVYAR